MSDTHDLLEDVSDTAFWVAHYRVEETERPDALFHDPLAVRLAGERGRRIATAMKRSRYTRWSVVTRTVVIDRYVSEAITEGFDTVVNLGAGLDTRPYRLELPSSLRWIEVDHPKIIDFKAQTLSDETPRCTLQRVGLDLANQIARQQLFAQINETAKQVLVLTEGVVPYLTPEAVASLADDLHTQPHFQRWITEYYAPELFRYLKQARGLSRQMKNAPFQFFPADWFGLFAAHGWREKQMIYLAEESDKLRRPMPLPWWANLLRPFMPAHKRASSKRFMGYALLSRSD